LAGAISNLGGQQFPQKPAKGQPEGAAIVELLRLIVAL